MCYGKVKAQIVQVCQRFIEWGPVLWYNLTVRLKRKEIIMAGDIKFEITEHIGVLSEGSKGWTK